MATWTQHHPSLLAGLSDRQRDVLTLIAKGKSNPEIAEALGVSLSGAKWHVSEVISRLGVETREEAAELWREEHSLPRRFSTRMHGLVGLGLFKVAAGGVALAGAGAAAVGTIVVVQEMRAADSDRAVTISLEEMRAQQEAYAARLVSLLQAPSEFPNAMYTRAEAKDIAHRLAQAEFDRYGLASTLSKDGRQLTSDDLAIGFYDFVEGATTIQHTLSNSRSENGEGRNVWTFEFTAEGLTSNRLEAESFFYPAIELVFTLTFEDANDGVLSSQIVWAGTPPK